MTTKSAHPRFSQMSPTASETLGLPSAEFGAQYTSLPEFPEEEKTPRGGHTTPDDSFVQHNAYFFKDGNVTFLLGIRDHEALPTIISLGDVERNDFEAFLSILYPANFEAHELTYKQWKSVLHLSTRWGFASLRKLALDSIKPPTPHDRLLLARTYSIKPWVLPALTALCERTQPLSLDEAKRMSMEDVILVATVREEIRGGAVRVDAVDIPRHVAETQLAKPEGKTYLEAWAEAESNTKEAETQKAKREAEAMVKRKAEEKAKRDLEAEVKAKTKVGAKAKREAEAKEKAEAGAMEKRDADAKVRVVAEAWENAKANSQEKLNDYWKAEAEADAKVEGGAKVWAEADAKAKAMAEALENAKANVMEHWDAYTKARAEASAKAEAETRAWIAWEKAKADADADADTREERAYAQAKAEAELADA
ncbi:hypothetical protein EDB83DRAFT_1360684 [Lactarius deliciosus]|nr:hypothetical protein EDB83DRAFT_1360684 [Lactarius deliciosus]